jgi:signal transduction histidine kinase
MVAHELKAPVAAVSGYLETMDDQMLGTDIGSYEKMIRRSKERLQALIDLVNDLLNISRRDLGTVRREITAVQIPEVVESIRELLQGEMQQRGLTFEARYDEGLPSIDVDREEFTRVVTNLLSNAIKYNRDDGHIAVEGSHDQGSVRLRVRDTGIGMKAEDQELLFRQFYRIKNDETRSIPGTGLGLSIVKQIVESYHGNIAVHSQSGEGTVFTLRIPEKFVDDDHRST